MFIFYVQNYVYLISWYVMAGKGSMHERVKRETAFSASREHGNKIEISRDPGISREIYLHFPKSRDFFRRDIHKP